MGVGEGVQGPALHTCEDCISCGEGGHEVELIQQGQAREPACGDRVGCLGQCLGDPSGIVGGVKTGIDGQGLSGAPACERLDGGRVAAGGEERACEAHSKTVEAVNFGLVLWEKSSEQEAEEAVDGGVGHGSAAEVVLGEKGPRLAV